MTGTSCASCGADNSEDARFCNQCGQAIAKASEPVPREGPGQYTPKHLIERVLKHRSAMQGERKQVTVLFADMANSTRLAEQVDPEVWHQILDEFFSILSEEIHRFEGTVNQYTGDGIMALFGAPLALEDHAQRAAFAALALRQRLRDFADRLRLQQGLNLSTRMGMNSGEVIVGSIGDDLRMDYTAKGLTVNLAARMEQIAEPGSVYLTRYTADLIEDYFRLRPLGPMPVKGSSEPIQVFELESQSEISLRLEASRQRGLTGFCGREEEMATLKSLQRDHEQGSRVCVVIGDAGLGKSRLCFEAGELWRQQGLTVLSVSGVPHGQAVPLQPIKALIRQRFEISADEPASGARRKLAGGLLMQAPELKSQLPLLFEFLGIADEGEEAAMPADARAHRMRDVFREICRLEPDQPRIIQIDDLHWLDPGSLEFLQIALECTNQSSFYLLNMRPAALPDWLQQMQPQVVQLQPLGHAAMLRIGQGLLGTSAGMPALCQRLADQAAGNPFFIEEAVRSLVAAGDLQGEPGHYQLLREPETLQIAPTVQATVAGRVDRLDSESKSLLQLAAVLGQSFNLKLLKAVDETPEIDLQARLSTLRAGHYLQVDETCSDRWQFCHPILREVVYASLLSQQRESLHRKAAHMLQQYTAKTSCTESHLLLSQHWAAVQEFACAAKAAYDAAIELQHHNAGESVRVMQQVIQWLDPVPELAAEQLLVFQACVMVLRAATFLDTDTEYLDECYRKARDIVDQLDDQALLAELMIANGARWLSRANADAAVANTGEAMRLAQEVAQQSGDFDLEQRYRIPILFSYFAAGRLREGLKVLDQRDGGAWHEGEVNEDNMLSRGFRALMLAAIGQMDLAESENHKAIACAEACQRKVSWLHANLVDLQIQRGHFDPQSTFAQQAVAEAREFGSPLFEVIALRSLAQTMIERGEFADAVDILRSSQHLVAPGAIAAQFQSAHAAILSQAFRLAGEYEDAIQTAQQGAEVGRADAQRLWLIRCLLELSKARLALNQPIHELREELEQLIECTGAYLYRGDVFELLALEAENAGDHASCLGHMRAAIAHWNACKAEPRAAKLEAKLIV